MLTMLLAAAVVVPMPNCDGKADCDVKWGRAIQWVMARNPELVQQTDTLIRTAESLGQRHFYQVTRIPLGGERYTLDLRIGCANTLWGCKWADEKRDFTASVGAP